MALLRMEWIPSVQWLLPGTFLPDAHKATFHGYFFLVKVCAPKNILGERGKTGCLC